MLIKSSIISHETGIVRHPRLLITITSIITCGIFSFFFLLFAFKPFTVMWLDARQYSCAWKTNRNAYTKLLSSCTTTLCQDGKTVAKYTTDDERRVKKWKWLKVIDTVKKLNSQISVRKKFNFSFLCTQWLILQPNKNTHNSRMLEFSSGWYMLKTLLSICVMNE